MIKIITKYDYSNRLSPGINFSPKTVPADRSLTNQADMDAADVNKIMAKYEKTGVLIDPLGVMREPTYGDFTEVKNYHEMMIAVRNVERAFATQPAKIKNRFNNNPQELIDFLENRDNDEEAIKLGLREDPNKVIIAEGEETTTGEAGVGSANSADKSGEKQSDAKKGAKAA